VLKSKKKDRKIPGLFYFVQWLYFTAFVDVWVQVPCFLQVPDEFLQVEVHPPFDLHPSAPAFLQHPAVEAAPSLQQLFIPV